MAQPFIWEYFIPDPEQNEIESDGYLQSLTIHTIEGYPEAVNYDSFQFVTYPVYDEGDMLLESRWRLHLYGASYFIDFGGPTTWEEVEQDRWNTGIRNFYRINQKLQRIHYLSDNYTWERSEDPLSEEYIYNEYAAQYFSSLHRFDTSQTDYADQFTVSWENTDNWPYSRHYNNNPLVAKADTNHAITTGSIVYGIDGSKAQIKDFEFISDTEGTLYLTNSIKPYNDGTSYIEVSSDEKIPSYSFPQVLHYDVGGCLHSIPLEHSILSSFVNTHPDSEIKYFVDNEWYCDLYRYVWDEDIDNPVPTFNGTRCNNTNCPYYTSHTQRTSTITPLQFSNVLFSRGLYYVDTDLGGGNIERTFGRNTYDGMYSLLGFNDFYLEQGNKQYYQNPKMYLYQKIEEDDVTIPSYTKTYGTVFIKSSLANHYINYEQDELDKFTALAYINQLYEDRVLARNGELDLSDNLQVLPYDLNLLEGPINSTIYRWNININHH